MKQSLRYVCAHLRNKPIDTVSKLHDLYLWRYDLGGLYWLKIGFIIWLAMFDVNAVQVYSFNLEYRLD